MQRSFGTSDLDMTALRLANAPPVNDLRTMAARIRGTTIEVSHRGEAPHLASSLSTVDVLTAMYWGVLRFDPKQPSDPRRDRFIFSKGHAAAALYSALAHRGAISWDVLATFNENGSALLEHPGPYSAPGIELATGSLGHGLPVGLGMAEAARIQGTGNRVFVLVGDGECNEGSVWEAALIAPARKLENLCVIVDYNKWQATDRSQDVTALEPLVDKWAAFGWHAQELDGHDIDALQKALGAVGTRGDRRPTAIVAHTVKGKGVSFMEDDNNWHYKICDEKALDAAFKELGLS